MEPAIKGALLSGLVFPGLGQMVLGRKRTGALFMLLAGTGMVGLFYSAARQMPLILNQLLPAMEKGALTITALIRVSQQIAAGGGSGPGAVGALLLLGSWLGAIVHALTVKQ